MPSTSSMRPKSTPNYLVTFRNMPSNLQESVDENKQQSSTTNLLTVPDRKPRPKSVNELSVTSWGGTGPTTPFQRCQRVDQAIDPKKGLHTHLPARKSAKSATTSSKQQYVASEVIDMGVGFTMSRNKQKITLKVTEEIREAPKKDAIRLVDREKEELIKRLQQQIADLTMFLEEERLNHKMTKQLAADELARRIDALKEEHLQTLRDTSEDHSDEIEELRRMNEFELSDLKNGYDKQLDELKKEMEFLQGSFESYKSSIQVDFDEKMFARETELYNQYDQEKDAALDALRNQLTLDNASAMDALKRAHTHQLQTMKQENESEVEAMMERFANASEDLKNLAKSQEELSALQKQSVEQKEEIEMLNLDIKSRNRDLEDSKFKVDQLELLLTTKIEEVDESYRLKIHNLMSENTEMRNRYIKKCEELFIYKVDSTVNIQQKAMDAKLAMQVVIGARNRAGINMTCSDVTVDWLPRKPYRRPLSAPATNTEESSAKQCAGETDAPDTPVDKRALFAKRPRSSFTRSNYESP